MGRKRCAEEQTIAVLNEAEPGARTEESRRRHGMTEATYYKRKAKYAGLTLNEMKTLRTLEDENRWLKQIIAQPGLDNWALEEQKTSEAHGGEDDSSICHRAPWAECGEDLYAYRHITLCVPYQSKQGDDHFLRIRMRELAGERKRFGSTRLHVMLEREGLVINHKRTERIYREERLGLSRKRRRKGDAGVREEVPTPVCPNQRWSMDFVSEWTLTGHRFRTLAKVDSYSRECLAIEVDTIGMLL